MKTTTKYLQNGLGGFMITITLMRLSILEGSSIVMTIYEIIIAMIVIGFGMSLLKFKE